jgi:hypothetical protein
MSLTVGIGEKWDIDLTTCFLCNFNISIQIKIRYFAELLMGYNTNHAECWHMQIMYPVIIIKTSSASYFGQVV